MPTVPADSASGGFDALVVFRYLDVWLLILATPFVILLGAPVLGYVVGAVAWIIQRFAAVAIERRVVASRRVIFLGQEGRIRLREVDRLGTGGRHGGRTCG